MNPILDQFNELLDRQFASVIGQTAAKEQCTEILQGAKVDGFLAPMLFIAPPGFGKSKLLGVLKAIIKEGLGRKTLLAVSGANLGTKAEFFEEIIIPKFHGQASVVISDEAHEATKGVLSSIRSMLEPTAERSARTIQYNDSDVTFDPFLNSFILATNKVDMLDAALVSRFERIDLIPYLLPEMEAILARAVAEDGIEFCGEALGLLASCNRGNARDVIHWANAIRRRVAIKGDTEVDRATAMQVIRSRKSFPEGVSALELATLLFLEKRGPLQLKELASMNQCSSDEQDSNERYLRQKALITVDGKRHLTGEGREYLLTLRREKFIDEIPCKAE